MNNLNLLSRRLTNQQIIKTKFTKPEDVVSYMCAMQAQDFAMAKWAIGLRLKNVNDTDIEKAFNAGKILRTHVMRPTWHFVAPKDIKWMVKLTAPRVLQASSFVFRQAELDDKIFKKGNIVLAKALQGGKFLTRAQLKSVLEKAKIICGGLRLGFFLMRAELDTVICSGPRIGKQHTYALLDERAPDAIKLSRTESLAELAKRYFTAHGPSTIADFVWWSGLTAKDAKEAIELVKNEFISETTDGRKYIFKDSKVLKINSNATFLMPDYDEYIISYKDRKAVFGKMNIDLNSLRAEQIANHVIIVKGIAEGTWQREARGNNIIVKTSLTQGISKTNHKAISEAVKRYYGFLGKS